MNVAIRLKTRQRSAWHWQPLSTEHAAELVNDGHVVGRTGYHPTANEALLAALKRAKRQRWTVINLDTFRRVTPGKSSPAVPPDVVWASTEAEDSARELAMAGSIGWSGATRAIPEVGSVVHVRGTIGPATVLGYFVAKGGGRSWLGLHVMPLDPPDWYVKQNGLSDAGVFGAEIEVRHG